MAQASFQSTRRSYEAKLRVFRFLSLCAQGECERDVSYQCGDLVVSLCLGRLWIGKPLNDQKFELPGPEALNTPRSLV